MRNTFKQPLTVFASAARTATESASFACGTLGGIFIIDATNVTATGSVVFTIYGCDVASSKTWSILASAAIVGTGTTVLRVHPELTAATNTIAKDMLPSAVKVTAAHANGVSVTYSVGFIGVN